MAASRSRRDNAGARMGKLIDEEDDDEFYKTTYGGFEDEAEDNDFDSNAEPSDSDVVDSDFDADENDEVGSDVEDDGEPKRKKRIVTKAYKEPTKRNNDSKLKVKRKKLKSDSVRIYHSPSLERKTLRQSTASKRQEVDLREREREHRQNILKEMAAKKSLEGIRRLTQEELLKEAKVTEEQNLRSLETHERLELEKKKVKSQKQTYKGPIIRYQSVNMPLIQEPPTGEVNVDADNESRADNESQAHEPVPVNQRKCSRTFITFTDEKVYNEIFRKKQPRIYVKQYCPITRLPAKYYDPITNTPYANIQAFKFIRDAFQRQNTKRLAELEKKKQELAKSLQV